MIRATFVKPTPTDEGITYILKGPKDKQALHAAADLMGEEVIIAIAIAMPNAQDAEPVFDDRVFAEMDAAIAKIKELTASIRRSWPSGRRQDVETINKEEV